MCITTREKGEDELIHTAGAENIDNNVPKRPKKKTSSKKRQSLSLFLTNNNKNDDHRPEVNCVVIEEALQEAQVRMEREIIAADFDEQNQQSQQHHSSVDGSGCCCRNCSDDYGSIISEVLVLDKLSERLFNDLSNVEEEWRLSERALIQAIADASVNGDNDEAKTETPVSLLGKIIGELDGIFGDCDASIADLTLIDDDITDAGLSLEDDYKEDYDNNDEQKEKEESAAETGVRHRQHKKFVHHFVGSLSLRLAADALASRRVYKSTDVPRILPLYFQQRYQREQKAINDNNNSNGNINPIMMTNNGMMLGVPLLGSASISNGGRMMFLTNQHLEQDDDELEEL